MTKPNPLVPMFRLMRDASLARCKITKWRMTEAQAYDVVEFLENIENRNMFEIFEAMKRGRVMLLHAMVEVRL